MEHGKRPSFNYCIDDITLKLAIGEKGVKKLQKFILCQNAACSRKYPLDTRYLTHPEGRINDKREEPNDLVNMQGDFNTTKQRERSLSNKNRKANANLPECTCIGKVIHVDTIAQTDGVHETKNKSTGIIKKKNIYTQSKEKYDAEEIDTCRNIKSKHSKQKNKLDVACSCTEKELNEIKISENVQPKKCSKWLEKRRCRSRNVWSRKVNDDYEIDASNNIKCHKQCISCTLDVRPNEYKMNKISKRNKKVSCICPQKEYKDSNICAKGISGVAYNKKKKREIVCKCKKKPGECTAKTCAISNMNNKAQSKSLIDIIKIRSLIECLCYHSKKLLSNKKPVNTKPIMDKNPKDQRICFECKPDAYKKDIKVAIKDKRDNSYKQKYQKICFVSKISNKKSPKKAEIREIEDDAIDRNVLYPEHKLTDLSQKNKVDPTSHFDNTAYIIYPCNIKNNKSPKKTVKCDCIKKFPKYAGNQAGEPIIKIEVDAIKRCVLNPDEIKHKLTNLNRKTIEKSTCICPSHDNSREQYLSKNLCEGRICQKMFKDKKTNFNCKCIIDKGGECTDRTCGGNIIKRKHKKCSTRCIQSGKLSEPQFEVKFDAKNMCLLNSEEINRKIAEIKAEANEVCPGGTCAVARCENRNLFKCKCVQKKPEITECSETTCVDEEEGPVDLLYYWMSKLTNKIINASNNKMKRAPFDTNELAKIKSMFSFICDRLKRTSEIWNGSEATKRPSCALSGLKEKKKQSVIKANYHKRSGLNLSLKKSRRKQPTKLEEPAAVKPSLPAKKSSNACGCAIELAKQKKKRGKAEDKEMDKEDKKLKKEQLKKKKKQKKLLVKQLKEERKEMKELSRQDEAADTNCVTDFLIGLCNLGIAVAHSLLYMVFKIITRPRRCYRYARRCMRHPRTTYEKVQSWAANKWRLQRFRMSRSLKGSRTMTIITDQFKESVLFKECSPKGATKKEKQLLEAQSKRRQQRIRKRKKTAMQGCRNILLVTMRKTPCLWVYHICPSFYPRFLSLRTNFIQVFEMCLFCLAIVVWTPCILCCELSRGCVCCLGCQ